MEEPAKKSCSAVAALVGPVPITILAIYTLALANFTGYPWVAWSGNTWAGNHFGWPFTYLSTPATPSQFEEAVDFHYYCLDGEEYKGSVTPLTAPWGQEVEDFHVGSLLANLSIAVLLATMVPFLTQFTQRSRQRPPQFTIGSLFMLTALCATVSAAFRSGDVYFFYIAHRAALFAVAFLGIVMMFALGLVRRRNEKERKRGTKKERKRGQNYLRRKRVLTPFSF
ncbi:MAG: hypothetical protein HQ581_22505 [Planctomycetes bacterium]|nr:hypothetical protein [Planctomycetota bacterium]